MKFTQKNNSVKDHLLVMVSSYCDNRTGIYHHPAQRMGSYWALAPDRSSPVQETSHSDFFFILLAPAHLVPCCLYLFGTDLRACHMYVSLVTACLNLLVPVPSSTAHLVADLILDLPQRPISLL